MHRHLGIQILRKQIHRHTLDQLNLREQSRAWNKTTKIRTVTKTKTKCSVSKELEHTLLSALKVTVFGYAATLAARLVRQHLTRSFLG